MRLLAVCVMAVGLLGCPLAAPERGEPVEGAPEVVRATFEVRANHTDVIEVKVFLPATAAAESTRSPALVFVQGGLVETDAYEWLAVRLAQRGVVVALPRHPLNLAFFSVGNGEAARELLVEPPEGSVLEGRVDAARVAVAGHSLGGVVATKLALDGGFSALALFASYPQGSDEDEARASALPVLSLAAEGDCQAPLEQVREGWRQFGGPRVLAVVEGAGHFQFTDRGEEDAARDCPPGISLDAAHDRIERVLWAFLSSAWSGGDTGAAQMRDIEGVRVEEPSP